MDPVCGIEVSGSNLDDSSGQNLKVDTALMPEQALIDRYYVVKVVIRVHDEQILLHDD